MADTPVYVKWSESWTEDSPEEINARVIEASRTAVRYIATRTLNTDQFASEEMRVEPDPSDRDYVLVSATFKTHSGRSTTVNISMPK